MRGASHAPAKRMPEVSRLVSNPAPRMKTAQGSYFVALRRVCDGQSVALAPFVVRRFLGDGDIMGVAFEQASVGDTHKAAVGA